MKSGAKYPLATIIGYGPDHKTATKLVVSIFKKPGQRDPAAMEKWIVQGGDIRQDPAILEAVANFIKRQRAADTITYDRVLGCPHQEGIDYPDGEKCPHCPFWANVDRHTLEPISLDQPLTPEQILAGLACERETQPLKGFAAVERHREQMIEPFLQAVEYGIDNFNSASPGAGLLFSYALAFLGKWREPRALPLVIRWLSLPGEGAFEIGGDTVTEWGPRLLASVCGGELAPIKELILNREANEYARSAAIQALALLATWNQRSQEEVADYFGWLAREGLEREPSHAWDFLAGACADIEATPAFDDLRKAGNENLIDPDVIDLEELDEIQASPRGEKIAQFRQFNQPFEDVAGETRWWNEFSKSQTSRRRLKSLSNDPVEPAAYSEAKPYIAPLKIGRNEPCPCGSGKKYKKCCGS